MVVVVVNAALKYHYHPAPHRNKLTMNDHLLAVVNGNIVRTEHSTVE